MRKIFLITLGALALFSCQKQSNPVSVETETPVFIKNIGATYQYAVTDTTLFIFHADSMQVRNDTATVEIIGYATLPNGKKAFLWQRNLRGQSDSILVTVSKDTVFLKQLMPTLPPILRLSFRCKAESPGSTHFLISRLPRLKNFRCRQVLLKMFLRLSKSSSALVTPSATMNISLIRKWAFLNFCRASLLPWGRQTIALNGN